MSGTARPGGCPPAGCSTPRMTATIPPPSSRYARQHFFLPRRFRDPFGNTTAVTYDRYDLLVSQTRDALGNLVTVGERDPDGRADRRRERLPGAGAAPGQRREQEPGGGGLRHPRPGLLAPPRWASRSSGSATPLTASSRTLSPRRSPRTSPTRSPVRTGCSARRPPGCFTTSTPTGVPGMSLSRSRPGWPCSPARPTSATCTAASTTKIQRSFSYSDGFGREVQHKGQAAAGSGQRRRAGRRAPLDRQRLDGLQQQGQAGPQVRAVLHRDATVRVRPRRRGQRGAVLRPGRAGRGHAASGRQLRQGHVRPVAPGHLGRGRHRAARPAGRPGCVRLHRPLSRRAQRAAGRLGYLVRAAHQQVRSAGQSSVPPSRRRCTRARRLAAGSTRSAGPS